MNDTEMIQTPYGPKRLGFLKQCMDAHHLLDWVAKCAYMNGPASTKAYFISDDKMQQIQELAKAYGEMK